MNRAVFASLFALAAFGCSAVAADDDSASSESANTEGRPLTVIKGRELGRCWFDVAGNDAKLSCTSTARGADPLESIVEVTAASTGDPMHFMHIEKKLDVELGGSVVVGTLPRSAFPVVLLFSAKLSPASSAAVGNTKQTDLELNSTIQRPEDLSASRPAIMKQPFDVWPVAFLDGETVDGRGNGGGAFSVRAEYATSIQPYKGFLGETSMALSTEVYGRDVKGNVVYFLSPNAGATIPLKLGVRTQDIDASLAQPGYYAVTASGLRLATTAEIARDFPASSPGTTDPGATPGSGTGTGGGTTPPDPSPPAPPAPSDPDPTCGGNGQARCAGVCDPGTRYDSSTYKCVSCGHDGQPYCLDGADRSSGNRTCDDGTRLDSSTYKCVACGGPNQTYCFTDSSNISGDRECNAGTRLDSNTYKCVPCGDAGQTYCLTDPLNTSGDRRCNAGTRLDTNTYQCVACGGNGQTYCFDGANNTSGNRVCAPGLHVNGNYVCVP